MTFEEARAQFPVLERIAYLNAGTFGPLAHRRTRRCAAELERDIIEGRSGLPYFERVMELRDAGRVADRRPRRRGAGTGGADDEHDRRLQHRARRASASGPATRSSRRPTSISACSAPSASRARARRRRARARRRFCAAVTPRTRLLALSQVIWTTGRVLPVRELREADRRSRCSSTARSRSAQSRSRSAGSTTSRSPARNGSAGPTPPVRSSSPSPIGCASRRRATSHRPSTSRTGRFVPRRRRRAFRPGLVAGVLARGTARGARHSVPRGPSTMLPRSQSAAGRCSRERVRGDRPRRALDARRIPAERGCRGARRRVC